MRSLAKTTTCIALGVVAALAAAAQDGSGVDVDAFASPSFDAPAISPDGEHAAVRRVRDDRPYLEVFRLSDGESVAVYPVEEGRDIGRHHFSDERTLLIQIRNGDFFWTDGYNQGGWSRFDIHTQKRGEWLFVNAPRRPLALMPRGLLGKLRFESFSDRFAVHAFDDHPRDVRVMFPHSRVSWVSRYDTRENRLERLADVPIDIFDVYSDRKGRVLAAWGYPPSASTVYRDQVQLLYRRDAEDEFAITLAGHIDDHDVDLVAEGPRKDTVYILEDAKGDTLGLSVLDLKDGSVTPVFRPARVDVTKTYLDGRRALYAVRYDDHFPQFHYPDPEHPAAILHRVASAAFKNMNVEIVSIARAAPQAIVEVSGDKDPGTYYLAELGGKRFRPLFERDPDVHKDALGDRHPIEFPAQGGSRRTGYVTLPKGHKQGSPIPYVVLLREGLFPHPATWGYSPEAQMFASLGLGVLEVNGAGTLGFGRKFHAAGVGRAATAIPGDIAAGLRYAVANADADPARVCIMGHRFGAYRALMAALRPASEFRCVVAVNGIYDMASLRKVFPIGGVRERFTSQIDRADADDAAIREISPRYLAARLRAPLLMVEARQYSEDLPGQARGMIRALKAAKIPHEVHEESTSRTNNMLTHSARRGAYARIAQFVLAHTQAG